MQSVSNTKMSRHNSSNTRVIINNYHNSIQNKLKCTCKKDLFNGNIISSLSPNINKSRHMVRSNKLQYARGGGTKFGTIDSSTKINYLGYLEGQPGGSGLPPLNRF